ncbi:MAG TPA: NAD(P)/FAD-dependent oxidoreductase, partial [Methylomirabilota bacterium]|nr:NAD(P)/FAD-dependent oxidoreductase [Methylomirabilota bacterium]
MGDLVDEVDVAVLGGGPGGYSAAFRCAELGLETVVIDSAQRLGGACLFEGCIPSKALLHVAAVLSEAERAKEFGVDFGEPRISLDPLRKWKQERVVGKLARGLASVAKARGVEVIGGRGVFEDASTLRIEVGETLRKVRFKHAIVATGSRPSALPGLTLRSERIMDSTAALELPDIPDRLLVIGGGYIGLELAESFVQRGARVTVVESGPHVLAKTLDADMAVPIEDAMRRLGIDVRVRLPVTGFADGLVQTDAGPLLADLIVLGLGVKPNTELLAETGIGLGVRDAVKVDR